MNILDPQGPVGIAQKAILLGSLGIMLAIIIPTIIAIIAFAFWFRASNPKAQYRPNWAYSGRIEMVVWSIPLLTIILLGGVAWIGSHDLEPSKPLESSKEPLDIQVVSLDWKWLFIYPRQSIATVNTLTVPAGVPLRFTLTSASVMNAFFIPQFGSMIYTMNGMTTRLNLQADNVGDFRGLSSHFSGDGFAEMGFGVKVVAESDFQNWAQQTGSSDKALNRDSYAELAKQSTGNRPDTYRLDDPHLFDAISMQHIPPAPGPEPEGGRAEVSPRAGSHQHVR
jgi:cytochrome o ubiquinol oxidase subunit 2